jgi:hypothetical protein
MQPLQVGPGDVLAVAGSNDLFAKAIRVFEKIGGRPHDVNHVVIITHQDDQGRWMGIAGQPGGVGPADMTKFLTQPQTNTNHFQPRPNDRGQLATLLASCAKSLGIAYDWVGIGADLADNLHVHDLAEAIDQLWAWPTKDGQLPGHVVCSSLAAKVYALVGWDHPTAGEERLCEPGDWWEWNHQWTGP